MEHLSNFNQVSMGVFVGLSYTGYVIKISQG